MTMPPIEPLFDMPAAPALGDVLADPGPLPEDPSPRGYDGTPVTIRAGAVEALLVLAQRDTGVRPETSAMDVLFEVSEALKAALSAATAPGSAEYAATGFSYGSEAAGYSLNIRDLTVVIGALMAFRTEAMGDAGREFVAYPETLGRYGMSITAEDHGDHGLALRVRLGEDAPAAVAPLPPGQFARVELPGYRQHTGWVTEETRAGAGVLVIRDWNGAVQAEVFPGAGCQIVRLPTPQKRPDPDGPRAITSGPVLDCGCGPAEFCEDCDPRPEHPF